MRLNLKQYKECLIALSRFKFSLVINGLTDILKTIDNTVGLIHFVLNIENLLSCIEIWWF
jgi:hypothetical protein